MRVERIARVLRRTMVMVGGVGIVLTKGCEYCG
jgi:hypothetical protein